MIIKIPAGLKLFRYDIRDTPESWDSHNHSNQTEYSCYSNKGKKNSAGFYFFYDNSETAKSVAKSACYEFEKKQYWLTTTKTKDYLSILDFSKCQCLHDILDILDTLGIDIYDSQMKINGFEAIWGISDLRNHNRLTRLITKVSELIEVSWFGQLLSDFNNGAEFKRLINSSSIQIDGYRWCEAYNPYGLTYCLFNNSQLDKPEKQRMENK